MSGVRPKKASIADVARLAGVSIGTVSNAINHPEALATPTLERVRKAIVELGFIPNSSARLLRTGSQKVIGLIVTNISNPYYTEIVRGVEDRVTESGYSLTLASSDLDPERERKYVQMFEGNGVSGVLAFTKGDLGEHFVGARNRGMELTLIDSHSPEAGLPTVNVDNISGGFQAMQHLIERGYQRFAMINGPHSLFQCRDRLEGAQRALRGAGLDVASLFTEYVIENMTAEDGETAFREIQALGSGTGVFCVNDLVALGTLRAVRNNGLSVPHDFGIVGYDDLIFSAELSPPLSSVRQPNYELGFSAADLLLSRLQTPDVSVDEQVVFQPQLIARESTSGTFPSRSAPDAG